MSRQMVEGREVHRASEKRSRVRPEQILLQTPDLVILTGNANYALAREVAAYLGPILPSGTPITLFQPIITFADQERGGAMPESIRGKHAVIIHPIGQNPNSGQGVNDSLIESFVLQNLVKNGDAARVTEIIPYAGYERSDKQDSPRQSLTAKLMAELKDKAGAVHNRAIVEMHNPTEQGFYDKPPYNISPNRIFTQAVTKERDMKNTIVLSPDDGGRKRAAEFAEVLGIPHQVGHVEKVRSKNEPNKTVSGDVFGNVKGKRVIIRDDILDTGGTLEGASRRALEEGAEDVVLVVPHALWNKDAYKRLKSATVTINGEEKKVISHIFVSDTLEQPEEVRSDPAYVTICSVAPVLAEVITAIHLEKSVDDLDHNART